MAYFYRKKKFKYGYVSPTQRFGVYANSRWVKRRKLAYTRWRTALRDVEARRIKRWKRWTGRAFKSSEIDLLQKRSRDVRAKARQLRRNRTVNARRLEPRRLKRLKGTLQPRQFNFNESSGSAILALAEGPPRMSVMDRADGSADTLARLAREARGGRSNRPLTMSNRYTSLFSPILSLAGMEQIDYPPRELVGGLGLEVMETVVGRTRTKRSATSQIVPGDNIMHED